MKIYVCFLQNIQLTLTILGGINVIKYECFYLPYNAVQAWLITSKHTVPETSSIFGW